MASLSTLLEDWKNYQKNIQWQLGRGDDIANQNDVNAIEDWERWQGVAPGNLNGVSGLAGTMIGESGAIRAGYGALINKAKELYANKVAPEEIWKQTRTMLGPDNKWMHEISDVGAKLNVNGDKINFYHPELEKAYPEYAKVGVKYGNTGNANAIFDANNPLFSMFGHKGTVVFNENNKPTLSTMLHEMQHWVQNHPENKWEPGSSPSLYDPTRIMNQVDKIPNNVAFPSELEKEANAYGLLKNQKLYSPYEMYKRNFGEAMARNTQERMNMYPDQLAKKYWIDTLDVPVDELTKTKMPFTKFGNPKTSLLNWMEPP